MAKEKESTKGVQEALQKKMKSQAVNPLRPPATFNMFRMFLAILLIALAVLSYLNYFSLPKLYNEILLLVVGLWLFVVTITYGFTERRKRIGRALLGY